MELFKELYDLFGVASLLVYGAIMAGRYFIKTIDKKDDRIKELEEMNNDLVTKNIISLKWFMEKS